MWSSKRNLLVLGLIGAILLVGCVGTGGTLRDDITSDLNINDARVREGDTLTVVNGATLYLFGELVVEGRIEAAEGPINIVIEESGSLVLNGVLQAEVSPEALGDDPDWGGIYIVVHGNLTIDPEATLKTNGHLIITDDEAELDRDPAEIAAEADSASGDMATLVPLPPDNPEFEETGTLLPGSRAGSLAPAHQARPTVTLSGNWDVGGFPGDQQIILVRFNFPADIELRDMQVSGPAAPDGENAAVDPDEEESGNARGGDGKKGLRLNIWSGSGSITIRNTTLTLTDGGDGGSADAICGVAEGGAGGESGNLRISAGVSIDVQSLTIIPGQAGQGGTAFTSCDEPGGDAEEAIGGTGASNLKRLFARGNVTIDELVIGPVVAGAGGSADAFAATGEAGGQCENGGPGGSAVATGGDGGDASLNVSGLPVTVGEVRGGDGGDANAFGGDGGAGGECPCGATEGGPGGSGSATAGTGGQASGGSPNTDGEDGEADEEDGEQGAGFVEVCEEDAFDLGLQLYADGDLSGALEAFALAVQQDPENPAVFYNLGVVYFELEDHTNALESFRQAIALDPSHVGALYGRALVGPHVGDSLDKQLSNWISVLEHSDDPDIRAYANQQASSLRAAIEAAGSSSGTTGDINVNGSFAHTNPGVSSEVYVDIQGAPGTSVQATLSGPSVVGSASKSGTIGANGSLRLTWTIDSFGNYNASGSVGSDGFNVNINVN